VGGPTAHEELFREIPVGAVSAPPLQSGLKMELFYAPSNICMNLALQKNYAIMLSTSRAAEDKKVLLKFTHREKSQNIVLDQAGSIYRIISD
jgi:hypothetical protein